MVALPFSPALPVFAVLLSCLGVWSKRLEVMRFSSTPALGIPASKQQVYFRRAMFLVYIVALGRLRKCCMQRVVFVFFSFVFRKGGRGFALGSSRLCGWVDDCVRERDLCVFFVFSVVLLRLRMYGCIFCSCVYMCVCVCVVGFECVFWCVLRTLICIWFRVFFSVGF